MTYTYLEHTADVGIRACGITLAEVFESGAEAMLNLIFNLDTIDCKNEVKIIAEAMDIAMLFVEVLNEILSKQDIEGVAFKKLKVEDIKGIDGSYSFTGYACGETLNLEKHEVKTEVKAATYAGLRHGFDNNKHNIQCILDV